MKATRLCKERFARSKRSTIGLRLGRSNVVRSLLILGILVVGSRPLFAEVDTGRPGGSTPYDDYLIPVRKVFAQFGGRSPSLEKVRAYLRIARNFRYAYRADDPYTPQSPKVTEARRAGDCKAKALWLANKIHDGNVRYVIGVAKPGDSTWHAWLLWSNRGTLYLLDPTHEDDVLYAERVAGRKLIAQYSYDGSTSFHHDTYNRFVRR